MPLLKCMLWLFCGLLVLSGCAAINVDVSEQVNWDQVAVVVLQPPPHDPWQLTPAIRRELQAMDLEIAGSGEALPDLLVRYFVKEGPDLNAEGDLLTRLQSVHIQFLDPTSKENVAVLDYFYPADGLTGPQDGIEEVFAELRQDVALSRRRSETPGQDAVPNAPAPPAPKSAAEPSSRSQSEAVSPAPTGPALSTQGMEVPPPREPAATSADEAAGHGAATAPAAPVTDPETPESTPEPPASRTGSPWIPRLESWGFENWGEDEGTDGY